MVAKPGVNNAVEMEQLDSNTGTTPLRRKSYALG